MKKLILLNVLIYSFSSMAFKMTPMSQTITIGEKKNSAFFTIINDSNKPIAIQLDVKQRKMNKEGRETHPNSDDFMIFPDQFILAAKGDLKGKDKRVVKVRWLKGKFLGEERAYRLIAEQLPISMNKKNKKQTGINILLRYVAALYVGSKNDQSQVKLLSYKRLKETSIISFELSNTGRKHQILGRPRVVMTQKDKSFVLRELKGVKGENILAGHTRKFRVMAPKKLDMKLPFQFVFHNDVKK